MKFKSKLEFSDEFYARGNLECSKEDLNAGADLTDEANS